MRSHYLLHMSDDRIARTSACRSLQTMRHMIEQKLVRCEENGEKELDKSQADLLLKIIREESSQRTLLANSSKRASNGGSTVGDK